MFDVLLGYPSLKKSRMRRNIGINCLMYLLRVLLLVNELASFFCHANRMASTFRLTKRLENVGSDIKFIEECIKEGKIPKGLQWNLKVQGLGEDVDRRVEDVKKDAMIRVMDVMLKGLKVKESKLGVERERVMDEEMKVRKGWEGIR